MITFLPVSVPSLGPSRTFESKIIQGERMPKLLNLAFIAAIYKWVTYLYIFSGVPKHSEGVLFKPGLPKLRRSAVFKSKIRNVSGRQCCTEIVESEDCFIAQNRPKINVQTCFIHKIFRSINENHYETHPVVIVISANKRTP